ncbi:hypothetical protein [Rhizobium sullae]|nr:hypothetical protein [Rhizobium sullae]
MAGILGRGEGDSDRTHLAMPGERPDILAVYDDNARTINPGGLVGERAE